MTHSVIAAMPILAALKIRPHILALENEVAVLGVTFPAT
jgi:hypothetical protein